VASRRHSRDLPEPDGPATTITCARTGPEPTGGGDRGIGGRRGVGGGSANLVGSGHRALWGVPLKATEFVSLVDHTLLKQEATRADIEALCREAAELHPASVCVNGLWVTTAREVLAGSDVPVCSVVGFPLGAMAARSVAAETAHAVEDGAAEIDMVVPVGLLKGGEDAEVERYVAAVKQAAGDALLKVILETALLTDDEIVRACRASSAAGADYVKTSTGFNAAGGATVEAVRLMRSTVGDALGVKASGGIRTREDVEAMVAAGASRLGMSSTRKVYDQYARA
jgi:deoxyribose-phosphate aldolase